MLAANNYPAHRTICEFRGLHLEELSTLFVQVVKLARECGLTKLGTIAVDGTTVKANASRHKPMSYERMQWTEAELQAQIAALLTKARATDKAERKEPQLDIPAEIERREERLEVIRAAKERLQERQRAVDADRLLPLGQALFGPVTSRGLSVAAKPGSTSLPLSLSRIRH